MQQCSIVAVNVGNQLKQNVENRTIEIIRDQNRGTSLQFRSKNPRAQWIYLNYFTLFVSIFGRQQKPEKSSKQFGRSDPCLYPVLVRCRARLDQTVPHNLTTPLFRTIPGRRPLKRKNTRLLLELTAELTSYLWLPQLSTGVGNWLLREDFCRT